MRKRKPSRAAQRAQADESEKATAISAEMNERYGLAPDANLPDSVMAMLAECRGASSHPTPPQKPSRLPKAVIALPVWTGDGDEDKRNNWNSMTAGVVVAVMGGLAGSGASGRESTTAKSAMEQGAEFLAAFVASMKPRDAIEESLVVQIGLAHSRSIYLNSLLTTTQNIPQIQILSDLADRAANTLRRLSIGLSEYRSPRKKTNIFSKGQTNIGDQQVIAATSSNGDLLPGKNNEKDISRGYCLPSPVNSADSPMGQIDRPANSSGEAAGEPERIEARPANARSGTTANGKRRFVAATASPTGGAK